MSKIYDRVKVIDGVLCYEGKPMDLDRLAGKLNYQEKVLAEVKASELKWAEGAEERKKESKAKHDAFMVKMEVRKDESLARRKAREVKAKSLTDDMEALVANLKRNLDNEGKILEAANRTKALLLGKVSDPVQTSKDIDKIASDKIKEL